MKKLPGAFFASVAAVLYGGLLVVLAFTLPVYSTSDGSGVEGSATLMDENGLGALVLIPLAIAGGVFWLLHLVCHHGSRLALAAAWTLTILTALLVLAGAMTVGLFFAPLAYLLIYACAATPRGRSLAA